MSKSDSVVTKYERLFFENNPKIGTKFWEVINREHHIDSMGQVVGEFNSDLDVFYSHAMNNRYVPRAVIVDLYFSL